MKNLIMSLTILAFLIFASPLKAQVRSDEKRLIVTQAEAARGLMPKGWDGKVQGLFRNEIASLPAPSFLNPTEKTSRQTPITRLKGKLT